MYFFKLFLNLRFVISWIWWEITMIIRSLTWYPTLVQGDGRMRSGRDLWHGMVLVDLTKRSTLTNEPLGRSKLVGISLQTWEIGFQIILAEFFGLVLMTLLFLLIFLFTHTQRFQKHLPQEQVLVLTPKTNTKIIILFVSSFVCFI